MTIRSQHVLEEIRHEIPQLPSHLLEIFVGVTNELFYVRSHLSKNGDEICIWLPVKSKESISCEPHDGEKDEFTPNFCINH
jgi:hypothetical protein